MTSQPAIVPAARRACQLIDLLMNRTRLSPR
jgi:hypothetical protein